MTRKVTDKAVQLTSDLLATLWENTKVPCLNTNLSDWIQTLVQCNKTNGRNSYILRILLVKALY